MVQGEENDETDLSKLVPVVTAVIGVFTALAGGLSAADGGLQRVLSNHSEIALIAVFLLLAAFVVGIIGTFLRGSFLRRKVSVESRAAEIAKWLGLVAVVLFTAGVLTSFVAVLRTAKDHHQPTINAEIKVTDGRVLLEGSGTTNGLAAYEHLTLRVLGVPVGSNNATVELFRSDLGPDRSGKVEAKFVFPLDPAYAKVQIEASVGDLKDPGPLRSPARRSNSGSSRQRVRPICSEDLEKQEARISCLRMPVDPKPSRPTLEVSPEGEATKRLLKFTVKQAGLTQDRAVRITATAAKGEAAATQIYSATLSPDGFGGLSQTFTFNYPADATTVCVFARAAKAKDLAVDDAVVCPPAADSLSSWVRLIL